MSRKTRKNKKKVVHLQFVRPQFCGFPLNCINHNRLWRWDTLEDVNLLNYGSNKTNCTESRTETRI